MNTNLSRRPHPWRLREGLAITALVLIAIVATAGTLAAHDTWLLPASMRVPVGRAVVLDLTSGVLFPNDDFAIAANRVTRTAVRLGSTQIPLPSPIAGPMSLRYRWTPATQGVATIGVELAPKTLTLAPNKIEEYFREINAGPELRKSWSSLGGKKAWVELYAKHATTFVRVGTPVGDTSWSIPLGHGLEIIPLRDPTALRVGDTLRVRVLSKGQPLPAFDVGAIRAGTDNAAFARTDAGGIASIVLGAPGKLLINGTNLRPSTNPAFVWESDFVTLTLSIAAR